MDKEVQYVFLTGGWDSTFLLIQELKKGKTIQPIYVIDEGRNGRFRELEAMNSIIEKVKEKNCFGGELLPIIQMNKKEIEVSPEEHRAYHEICKTVRLGTQYEWLAAVANKYKDVCLGIEKPNGEFSGCVEAILHFGAFANRADTVVVDEKNSQEAIILLFGNMQFPIVTLTENDMVKLVKEWNVEDIMQEIWFCHQPIHGEACGFCRPCQQKMESNMQFLLSEEAQKRYHAYHHIKEKYGEFISKIWRKIMRWKLKKNQIFS